MKDYIHSALREAHARCREQGRLSAECPPFLVEESRNPEHGELCSNIALAAAKAERKAPRMIADALLENLPDAGRRFTRADVGGAGFINFVLTSTSWHEELRRLLAASDPILNTSAPSGKRIQIEFVSANPTGPLNVVNARAASLGDSLTRILRALGETVDREFYINDAGHQVKLLGASVEARVRTLAGEPTSVPEGGYHGEYLRDLAAEILAREGHAALEHADSVEHYRDLAVRFMVALHRRSLEQLGVTFERWFSEREMHEDGRVWAALERLRALGHTYRTDAASAEDDDAAGEAEGPPPPTAAAGSAELLRTTAFGDDKDRVLVRSDGRPTYFLADIAYHLDKLNRGYDLLLDIWGPDHHGHIARMKAALAALGKPADAFDVLIAQQVNLIQNGERLKMSKRAGKFFELDALVGVTGADAARFFFVNRRFDSHLDFDVDLATSQTQDNPVYYIQYAHARIASVFTVYEERQGAPLALVPTLGALEPLALPEELGLIRALVSYPDTVKAAAAAYEPHRIATFLHELATKLQQYYQHHRFIVEDEALTAARLYLVRAVQNVLRHGLGLLGVSAPDRM
ncbi:MAG: arginine--tRNA ligase [Candidatus Schekmanbacteria bacterium]|nr:arginine--tRNA ligase [Candidatus Schekmanbacteria bacterium]